MRLNRKGDQPTQRNRIQQHDDYPASDVGELWPGYCPIVLVFNFVPDWLQNRGEHRYSAEYYIDRRFCRIPGNWGDLSVYLARIQKCGRIHVESSCDTLPRHQGIIGCLVAHTRSCRPHSASISLVQRGLGEDTHLHLCRHASSWILSSVYGRFSVLSLSRIILGHVHRHIDSHRRKS